MALDFFRVVFVALDQLTEQGELREAGANLVVDVTRYPGPLFLEGLLLLQGGELALQPLRGDVVD